ncbi:hypothetical protein Gpo141_00008160 [Globisporangium polare]
MKKAKSEGAVLLPPLPSVLAVLRTGAGAAVGAVPHVVSAISSLLDCALPAIWSLPRACERNSLPLVLRLHARGLPGERDGDDAVDPFYWASQCSRGLVFAVRNGNLEMVEWLHGYHPTVLPYTAMIEAARSGHLGILQWLLNRHEDFMWLPQMMEAAASRGQVHVLQWLHSQPTNCDYNSKSGFRAAVRGGHLDAVRWFINKHYADREPLLYRSLIDAIRYGHTEVAKFLMAHSDSSHEGVSNGILLAAQRGDLELVQWLFSQSTEAGVSFDCRATKLMDCAAGGGHLHVVQWVHEHHRKECTEAAMNLAAGNGSLDVVQWLHVNRIEGCTVDAMNSAAMNGHFDIVQWLHANRSEGCTEWAMDAAAKNGHLDIVKWLHDDRKEGCSVRAMDFAAENGHLEVVQWLHSHRSEGCTTEAMDGAAKNGFLNIVQWLQTNRSEGCTVRAMDDAAENGHLEMVKWLHENRAEGCTVDAMDFAAENGHLDIVTWLHENRSEDCTADAMYLAAVNGHFEILLFLHANRSEGCAESAFQHADTCIEHLEIVQWLGDKYPDAVDVGGVTSRDYYMSAVFDHIFEQGA